MAESQIPKNISDAIAEVLPNLPDQVVKSVEDLLMTLGAATTEDLQYITEGDLLPVLKPVQARRLVAAWAQKSKCKTLLPQHITCLLYSCIGNLKYLKSGFYPFLHLVCFLSLFLISNGGN